MRARLSMTSDEARGWFATHEADCIAREETHRPLTPRSVCAVYAPIGPRRGTPSASKQADLAGCSGYGLCSSSLDPGDRCERAEDFCHCGSVFEGLLCLMTPARAFPAKFIPNTARWDLRKAPGSSIAGLANQTTVHLWFGDHTTDGGALMARVQRLHGHTPASRATSQLRFKPAAAVCGSPPTTACVRMRTAPSPVLHRDGLARN